MSDPSKSNYGPSLPSEENWNFPFLLEDKDLVSCLYCGAAQKDNFVFCSNCGRRRKELDTRDKMDRADFNRSTSILVFYGIYFAALVIINEIMDHSYQNNLLLSISDAIITLIFFFTVRDLWKIILPKRLNVGALGLIVGIALCTPWLVGPTVNLINESLNLYDGGLIFYDADYPLLSTLLVTAVFPGIFEELTYRGFLFHYLNKISGPKAAIWASSIIFAIVHFSLISVFWILPFGLLLAYFRHKYNTLIYGMVCHMMHNAGIVLADYYGWF